MGNAESLAEESHEGGLLEYPVYTKPASWRGLDVPPVLLGGDHGRIAAWRHEQALSRTADRRPDLLHPSHAAAEWTLEPAVLADAGEIMTLWRACWMQEAVVNQTLEVPVLGESYQRIRADLETWQTWVVRSEGRLVATARGKLVDALDGSGEQWWLIGRICAAPDLQGRGLGRLVLEHVQATAPAEAAAFVLFTGHRSEGNHRFYKRNGFRLRPDLSTVPGEVTLTKRRR
jgi:tRNA (guanine37-N1)-methyltransferase